MTNNKPQNSSDDSAVLGVWRQLSQDYLRDAEGGQVSALSKEDLAFEAGYLFALTVLGVHQAKKYSHPGTKTLQAAASKLGWPLDAMNVATDFLHQRYEPNRDGSRAVALLGWAHRMQAAAS